MVLETKNELKGKSQFLSPWSSYSSILQLQLSIRTSLKVSWAGRTEIIGPIEQLRKVTPQIGESPLAEITQPGGGKVCLTKVRASETSGLASSFAGDEDGVVICRL